MARQKDDAVVFHFRGEEAPSLLSREEEIALAKALKEEREKVSRAEKRIRAAEKKIEKTKIRAEKTSAAEVIKRAAEVIKKAEVKIRETEDRFVEANIRLVISLARQYRNRSVAFADLIQEGNIGLVKAVRRFDWRRGLRFSTYAVWWIRHYMNRAIQDQAREVRIPNYLLQDMGKLRQAQAEFRHEHDRDPEEQELAAKLKWKAQKVREVIAVIEQSLRFPAPIVNQFQDDEPSAIREESLPNEGRSSGNHRIFLDEVRQCVDELLPQLDPVERDIVQHRLRQEFVMNEIGQWHNLSRERIRQKELVVIKKLRRHLARRLGITEVPDEDD